MNVVSNTSPLCYLRLIEQVEILPALFGEILIPQAVREELQDEGAPASVRQWIASPPAWLQIVVVSVDFEPDLRRLHRGEQEAILLSEQLSADLILLDEKAARRAAIERGFHVTGLVGLLDRAATAGLIDVTSATARLSHTNFHIAPRLLKAVLNKHVSSTS